MEMTILGIIALIVFFSHERKLENSMRKEKS